MNNNTLIEYLEKQKEEDKKHYRLPNESDVDYRQRILEIKESELKKEV